MKKVIETTRSTGMSAALVRNATGPAVPECIASLAVDEQMVGLAMNNTPPPRFLPSDVQGLSGNQAFAIASPAGQNPPLVLDAATSGIALARVDDHNQSGERLSKGDGLAGDGQPTFDPVAALDKMLRPTSGHGFGLSKL